MVLHWMTLMKMMADLKMMLVLLIVTFQDILINVPHASGQCTFPEFLWKQSSREHLSHIINSNFKNLNHNNFSKTWITEEVHTSKSRKFKSRKLIAATRSTLVISVQDQGFCKTGGTCEMEERVITTMKCYKDVGNQTFKVMRSDEGDKNYVCYKFVNKSANVVLLWISKPCDSDIAILCDSLDKRQEWPWIAQDLRDLVTCPIVGGFEVRTEKPYITLKKSAVESACRVARLESECMQGEGMTFNFLESPHCNLFDVEGTTNKLSCVGWWREDSYTFILATDNGINVQYAMRYEAMKSSNIDETSLLLYFSPICPTIKKGSPPSQVMHTLLKLNRPAGMCQDECKEGGALCKNTKRFNHGKSACAGSQSGRSECTVDESYHENYLSFTQTSVKSLTIGKDGVIEEDLQKYFCKEKFGNMYKVESTADNGCFPRFLCMHVQNSTNSLSVQFLAVNNGRDDITVGNCKMQQSYHEHQHDKQLPYYSHVNQLSKHWSNIEGGSTLTYIPTTKCKQFQCGLGGLVHVRLAVSENLFCEGTLSDWNPFLCMLVSKLSFISQNCTHPFLVNVLHKEIICEASTEIAEYKVMYTKEVMADASVHDSCLLVELGGGEHNEPERRQAASWKHWKRAVSSSRHDCAQFLDGKINAPFIFNKFNTHFHIMSNTSEPTCIRMTKMTVKNDSRSTVDIKYYVTGNKNQADASNQAYPQGQALHQQNDHLLYASSQSSPRSRQLSRSLFYIGLFFIVLK